MRAYSKGTVPSPALENSYEKPPASSFRIPVMLLATLR